MNRFYSIIIAVAITSSLCLFGMVNNSDAEINIIVMDTPSEAYNDGYFYHHVHIETDKPFDGVDWFMGDPDDGDGYDLTWKSTTSGDGVTTRAWFYPNVSDIPGHIKGKKYRVAARAWYTDDNNDGWSVWESRDFTVFKSILAYEVEDPPKRVRSVSAYSKLTRQYYTGDAIKIDCYAYAYNPYETKIYAWSRFRHSLTGRLPIVRDHPNPDGENPQRIGGKFGSYSHSDTLPHYNINLEGNSYNSDAYVRLVVIGNGGEDHYLIENPETFDKNDRPYDAPDDE